MKKTIQLAALTVVLCGAMIGCRPEKKTLGPKPSQTEGISNTGWVLSRVDEIDVNVQLAFVESDTLMNVTETFIDRKSTRLNSSHIPLSRMPSSA